MKEKIDWLALHRKVHELTQENQNLRAATVKMKKKASKYENIIKEKQTMIHDLQALIANNQGRQGIAAARKIERFRQKLRKSHASMLEELWK
jgi:hypothetical protein